jgi:hypothetical protein
VSSRLGCLQHSAVLLGVFVCSCGCWWGELRLLLRLVLEMKGEQQAWLAAAFGCSCSHVCMCAWIW